MSKFDPAQISTFRFVDYDFDESNLQARLRYALDELTFEEEVFWSSDDLLPLDPVPDIDRLLWAFHLVAGLSYYKAAAPKQVQLETRLPSPVGAAFLEALYTQGLAEFRFVNDLDLTTPLTFSADAQADGPERIGCGSRILIPVGGGKDSVVTIESLRARHHVALFAVGRAEPIEATIRIAALPAIHAFRVIDRRLLSLNEEGAYNGHVPVTAIISTAALLAARLFGLGSVAMSNERSASETSRLVEGIEVNHQFSKSAAAEKLLRSFIEADVAPGLDYFSFLRPFSEIAIARRFSALANYHHAFTSCNHVFRIDPTTRGNRWCCDCPKCRFVFLVLAPFVGRRELTGIFGKDILNEPAQVLGYEELLAMGREKPFECVGEVAETRALVGVLAQTEEWRDAAVVRSLAPRLARDGRSLDRFFVVSDGHDVPPQFVDDLESVLSFATDAG